MHESNNEVDTINFKTLFSLIWKEKILFFSIVLVFIIAGLWYGFTRQEQFTTQGKILPELQSKSNNLDNLAGLASLAGVDLGSIQETEAIRPDLYPDVLKSTPFFLELFKQKVTMRDNRSISFEKFYRSYIEQDSEIPEEELKKFPVKEEGFIVLNRIGEKRLEVLRDRINVNIDKKSGIITISVKMPDPVVAAGVARFSMIYLTEYVSNYRTDKSKKDLDFLSDRVSNAKGKFYSTQEKKAQYSDQFQLPTIRSQTADIQRERIESEYRVSSAFYSELLKKYEEARIKVQQETPVFQVLEPPVVPTYKSEPKRAIILLIAMFIGGAIGVGAVLLRTNNFQKIWM